MNRLLTLTLIGFAGLLVSCGSSVNSSTQPATNYAYTMVVSPTLFTLNAGDWSSITASVEVTYENSGAPKPVSPQPTIKYYSSDSRITISPAGEVCAGQWDARYLTCTTAVVYPPSSPYAGEPDIPTGYVTITAYDATRNVSATALVSVHQRAATIKLSAPVFPGAVTTSTLDGKTVTNIPPGLYPTTTGCVSENNFAVVNGKAESNTQVQYVATPYDANGNAISPAVSNVFANDYTWSTDNPNVAAVSNYGFVVALNPGVTNVYASLNGTTSVPLAFVTCPPSAIVLGSSPYTGGTPLPPPYPTTDLDVTKGTEEYMTAEMVDRNGNAVVLSPLNYTTSDPLTGSFTTVLPLTSKLTANTSGRFSMVASCEPAACNPAVANFVIPGAGTTTTPMTGEAAGFGYPIYSNVIGVTVTGLTGTSVLVTGSYFADGLTPIHRLEVYDSESLINTNTVAIANLPNSLVVAPNGATAYVGSSAGLVVVNLTTYQSALQTYPILGGISTEVVTGKVLGVSPDSRYVVTSDGTYLFLIDTTGTKVATRYSIPGIDAVTFASDGSNMWIGGAGGVYVFNSDAFVKTATNASSGVKALAWMPDGQSYFASGDQLENYSTCNDQKPTGILLDGSTTGPINLDTTAINGVPYVFGLAGSEWLNYSVTTTAQVPGPTTANVNFSTLEGNVCLSTVKVNGPVATPVSLPCAATQITFSPRLEAEFVTGVDPSCTVTDTTIHGYEVATQAVTSPITTAAPGIPLSGGVLNDGRKLYFGTWAGSTVGTATLHRIDLSTGTATTGNLLDGLLTEDLSTSIELIPSFVAVVPK